MKSKLIRATVSNTVAKSYVAVSYDLISEVKANKSNDFKQSPSHDDNFHTFKPLFAMLLSTWMADLSIDESTLGIDIPPDKTISMPSRTDKLGLITSLELIRNMSPMYRWFVGTYTQKSSSSPTSF